MLEERTEKLLKGIPKRDADKIKKIVNGLTRLTFSVLKFLATLYIFNRVYARIGFGKTIITLLIVIIVLLLSNGRKDFVK